MVLLENAFIILMWTWAEERGRPSSPCPYLITAHPSAMAWEPSGKTAQFLSNARCHFSWACGSLGVFWTRLDKIGFHRGWKKIPVFLNGNSRLTRKALKYILYFQKGMQIFSNSFFHCWNYWKSVELHLHDAPLLMPAMSPVWVFMQLVVSGRIF